jgi:hypothetical protein
MDALKASGKPFRISKREVWDAWVKVKGNQGVPGVDGQSVEEFEKDLRGPFGVGEGGAVAAGSVGLVGGVAQAVGDAVARRLAGAGRRRGGHATVGHQGLLVLG